MKIKQANVSRVAVHTIYCYGFLYAGIYFYVKLYFYILLYIAVNSMHCCIFYILLCISMYFYVFLCFYMFLYIFLCFYMYFYALLYISMYFYALPCISTYFYALSHISMQCYILLCISMHCYILGRKTRKSFSAVQINKWRACARIIHNVIVMLEPLPQMHPLRISLKCTHIQIHQHAK